jgi:hypothetical protein
MTFWVGRRSRIHSTLVEVSALVYLKSRRVSGIDTLILRRYRARQLRRAS